jgi:hypothetical protein
LAKWDLSSKYNSLDQDYETQYINGIKFYLKISEKFNPEISHTSNSELYDEKELQLELPRDENDEEDNEEEACKPSNFI